MKGAYLVANELQVKLVWEEPLSRIIEVNQGIIGVHEATIKLFSLVDDSLQYQEDIPYQGSEIIDIQ